MGTRPATHDRRERVARALRRVAGLALLVAAAACGASDGPGVSDSEPTRGLPDAPDALRAGDLLVLDMDAGAPNADGERTGVVFRARFEGGADASSVASSAHVTPWAADARWLEPVDLLLLPDGALLVLEQAWAPGAGAARGAIFHVAGPGAEPALWWSDPRTRQPVAMARRSDGTLLVSDRTADPAGLGGRTGCVFSIEPSAGEPSRAGTTRVAASGRELVTPGALLAAIDGRLLLLDADANPRGLRLPDGRAATPGVLYELLPEGLQTRLEPEQTVSPIALIERRPGEIYLVDANAGTAAGMLGDGALYRVDDTGLLPVLDTASLGRPRALVDPVGGDVLSDGRLVLADANADPLGLGEDGTGKGVYGTGHGAVLIADPDARTLDVLLADPRFVSPVAVRRVR